MFAHQDDEYGAAPWIESEIRSGSAVHCVYLTDGSARVSARVRDEESRHVLARLGVSADHVTFASSLAPIRDLTLAYNVVVALERLEEWLDRLPGGTIARLYAPAWEGGHPDHDAAHLVALVAAFRRNIIEESWQFALYNAYRCPKPFFKVLTQLPSASRRHTVTYGWLRAWRYTMLCWSYPSQFRTWLGLFPGAFMKRFLQRRESVFALDPPRVLKRPHQGELLYERLFGMEYSEFTRAVEPLRATLRLLSENKVAAR